MNNGAEHIEYLDLIVKTLSGESTHEEGVRLKSWIDSDNANLKVYNEYIQVWNNMDKVNGKTSRDVDFEWKKLENAIDADYRVSNEYSVLSPEDQKRSMPFLKIAAAIIIFISIGSGIFYLLNSNNIKEVGTQVKVEQIQLPEGTLVSLNVDSKLSYAKKFEVNVRTVELEGEAFFEVARDTLRPFIIKSGDVYVEVLGTSFNVKANKEDKNIEVTVESGKVAVYLADRLNEKVILIRGQKAIFKKSSGVLEMTNNDNINFKAWKTKKIIFEDTPMSEVVKIVNEIYQSDLKLVNEKLANCPVTTEFDNQSFETILNVLTSTLDLSVKKNGNTIEISGPGC